MDFGPCPRIHSEKLKSEYEEAKKQGEVDYELEFERSLANFVSDCDRRITSAQKRLDKTPEDNAKIAQLVYFHSFIYSHTLVYVYVSILIFIRFNVCHLYRLKKSRI